MSIQLPVPKYTVIIQPERQKKKVIIQHNPSKLESRMTSRTVTTLLDQSGLHFIYFLVSSLFQPSLTYKDICPPGSFPFIFCKLRIIVGYDFHFFLISLAKRGLLTPKKNRHVQNRACPSRNFNAITSLCNYKRDQPCAELGFWLNRSYNN